MIIFFVFAMTIILVIGAIVVDVGLWLTERRRAQTAADLAALAAAVKLTDSDAATIAQGLDYADRNGFDDAHPEIEVVVTPQYNGDPELVEVTVSETAPVLFLGIFGIADDIGARAVARLTGNPGAPGQYAIFANRNNNCSDPPPLEISGSDSVVVGKVHSNSDAKVNGSNNDFDGEFTYACDLDLSGSDNQFDPGHDQTGQEPMPIDYEYDDFPCHFEYFSDTDLNSKPEVWLNNDPNTNVLKTAVICSTADLQLSDSDISGQVTLVAGDELKISGSNFNLTPYFENVLFFSARDDDAAIDISASGGSFTGYIHAPDGQVKIQGQSNLSIIGSVIADRVQISGSNFSIDASGQTGATPSPPSVFLEE